MGGRERKRNGSTDPDKRIGASSAEWARCDLSGEGTETETGTGGMVREWIKKKEVVGQEWSRRTEKKLMHADITGYRTDFGESMRILQ